MFWFKSLTLHCVMISHKIRVGIQLLFQNDPKWSKEARFLLSFISLFNKLSACVCVSHVPSEIKFSLSPSNFHLFRLLPLSPLPVSPVFLVGRCGSLALPPRWRSGAVPARRSVCGGEGAVLGASRRNASFSDHLPKVPAAATGRDGDQHGSRCAWQCKIYDLNSVPFSSSALPVSR